MGGNRVLIVGGGTDWRRELAKYVRRFGDTPCLAASPLEAIDRLVECGGGLIQTAYVAQSLGSATGDQFVRFLAEEFPGIRCVLLPSPRDPDPEPEEAEGFGGAPA